MLDELKKNNFVMDDVEDDYDEFAGLEDKFSPIQMTETKKKVLTDEKKMEALSSPKQKMERYEDNDSMLN